MSYPTMSRQEEASLAIDSNTMTRAEVRALLKKDPYLLDKDPSFARQSVRYLGVAELLRAMCIYSEDETIQHECLDVLYWMVKPSTKEGFLARSLVKQHNGIVEIEVAMLMLPNNLNPMEFLRATEE